MTHTSETLLIQAKEHFYALRLLEAYAIFRRFFDRIPFQPEKRHAEYIGMFARTLAELGKTSELKFYMGELERWNAKLKDPSISYQLAIVYCYLPEPKIELARQIFESLLKDPRAEDYRLKARMMLADYQESKGDRAACRQLIFSIELKDIHDPTLREMYQVWRAEILRDENRFDEARANLDAVLSGVTSDSNWYVFWWTKIILGRLSFQTGKTREGQKVINEVNAFLKTRRCRSLEAHLKNLIEFGALQIAQKKTVAKPKNSKRNPELQREEL